MNLFCFLLGFIEAKPNLGQTPRWHMKFKSITQIEDCIIHVELKFVIFIRILQGDPALFSFLSVAPVVSLLVAFFIFLIAVHLHLSLSLHCDFGKMFAKRNF